MLVLEGLVGLHRTVNFSFFSIPGWDIDLDYCDIEWFALEMNRDHSVIFEIASKYCIFGIFCRPWWLLHFFWGIPARSSRYNGHLSYIHPFQSISVHWFLKCCCSLAIFCLTTSNLPWFMDLTFQVPMHYCSLQHQTLLPSTVTSTAGHYFCFGSVSSFFLELFLHSSPVAYWGTYWLGKFIFQCNIFLPFHTVHGVLMARILK